MWNHGKPGAGLSRLPQTTPKLYSQDAQLFKLFGKNVSRKQDKKKLKKLCSFSSTPKAPPPSVADPHAPWSLTKVHRLYLHRLLPRPPCACDSSSLKSPSLHSKPTTSEVGDLFVSCFSSCSRPKGDFWIPEEASGCWCGFGWMLLVGLRGGFLMKISWWFSASKAEEGGVS